MTTPIERILKDVIEKMNIDGYECDGMLANTRLSENISDKEFPLFCFEVQEEVPDSSTYETNIKFWFALCFSSEKISKKIVDVERWEFLRELYMQFHNRLKSYSNEFGQIEILELKGKRKSYYDLTLFETATTGFSCDFELTTLPRKSC